MPETIEQHSVVHSTFSIERTYPFPPSRVFHGFADQETKRRWFAEGEEWHADEFTLDFRLDGSHPLPPHHPLALHRYES